MTFQPSPAQQNYFQWITEGRGSAVLIAVAGAGKTTTVIEGIGLMSGSVTVLAFNRDIASEISRKLAQRGYQAYGRDGKAGKTFHSVGLGMLRERYPDATWAKDPRDGTTDKKVLRIAEEYVRELERRDLEGLESAIAGMVSMAKQRGIGAICEDTPTIWREMVDHFSLDDALPEGQEHMVEQAIWLARRVLDRSCQQMDTIDYDDMIYMPLRLNLRVKWQSDWVVIDEAQDTNPTRRALATRMLRRGGRLVAVGDPHQAIYGFTGTDNDSLEQIAEQFDCTRLPLTVTYRCPHAVVDVARQFVNHIEAHESAPMGEVVSYDYSEVTSRVQVGDAILSRYNKYLVSLVFKLIRMGVPAKIEGRSIGEGLAKLAGRWKSIKTLNALENKLVEYQDKEIGKAKARDDERKIEEIKDRHETMMVLIARAREKNMNQVSELQEMIMSLFEDNVSGEGKRPVVNLCSIHRSKGREWRRVHILGLYEIMPGRCSMEWQMSQEENLRYVAVTRAMDTLFLVTGIRTE